MKKTYTIKNYKGNLVESLKKFSESHKGMKILEAVKEDNTLKIKAEESEDIEGQAGQEAVANSPSYIATTYDDNFFKDIKEKAEKKLSIFTQWEPKNQHEISADQRKDIQMKLEMAIVLLEKAAPYAKKGEQIKRKVASKIYSIHDKLLSICTDIDWLTR